MQLNQWIRVAAAALGFGSFLAGAANGQTPCQGGDACNGCLQVTASVTDFENEQPPPWMKTLEVPAFDGTLGTLAKVEVIASVPTTGQFFVENTDPFQGCAGGTWNLRSELDLDFDNGGISIFDMVKLDQSTAFPTVGPLGPFDGTIDFRGMSGETIPLPPGMFTFSECYDDPLILSDFIGMAGDLLMFTAQTSPIDQTLTSTCAELIIGWGFRVALELTVTYTYCPNDPPTAAPDKAETCAGDPVDIDILGNDSDPDGAIDCGAIMIVSSPQHGVAVPSVGCTGSSPCAGCVVTYTPKAGYTGSDSFDYMVLDDEGCPSNVTTVSIQVRTSPTATPDSAFTCQGTQVQIPVLANDFDPIGDLDCASLQILSPPANGTAVIGPGCTGTGDCAGCFIVYTPNPGFAGGDGFVYSVANTIGCVSNPAAVTIEVGANPIAAPDTGFTCQNVPVQLDILANDGDPDGALDCGSITITTQPANGTVAIGPGCTGSAPCATCRVIYTPNPGFVGTDIFRYRVRDEDGCRSANTSVTVNVGANPIAAPDSASTCQGIAVQIPVLANDVDPDGNLDCGSIQITSPPPSGTVTIGPGCAGPAPCASCRLIYTPAPGFTGPVTFQYTVGDLTGCRSGPATVTVDVGARPIVGNDMAQTCQGQAVQIAILQNDTDPDGALACGSVTIVTPPTNGSAMITGCTGTSPCTGCRITYTPNPGFSGIDSFQYTVADTEGCISGPGTVTVDVSANPVAAPDAAATCQGQPVEIAILANDSDPDGQLDCGSIQIVTGPGNGSVVLGPGCNGSGPCPSCRAVYSPTPGFFGTDQFTYRVRDNRGCLSNPATVTIAVNGNPVAAPDTALTCQGDRVNIPVLGNDSDPDGTLNCGSIVLLTKPAHGMVSIGVGCSGPAPCAGCVLTYTPNPGYWGMDSFQYAVSDTQGCSSNAAVVSIEVSSDPVAMPDAGFTCQGDPVSLAVLANDSDPDGGPIDCGSIEITNMPTNGTVVIGPGCAGPGPCPSCELVYTPNPSFVGEEIFRYRVADQNGCFSQPVQVVVQVQTQPVVEDDMAETCEGFPVDIDVLANDSDGINGAQIQVIDPPDGGSLIGPSAAGVFTYVPNGGFCGVDTFSYQVGGSGECPSEVAVVTIDVSCEPFAEDDYATKLPDVSAPINTFVLANDGDPDGALVPSSVMVVIPPEHGTILGVDPTNGMISYECGPTFVNIDEYTYSVLDDDGCEARATVHITLQTGCPETVNRRRPGSLLLYPEFDNRDGIVTIVTVTNTRANASGDVQAHFVYRDKDGCGEFDRSHTLTPNDTLTLITNVHNPNYEQGYLYVYARCGQGSQPIAYNGLIGNLLVVNGLDAFSYSVNPVSFRGIGQQASGNCPGYLLTDADGDGVRDLDGVEYEKAPDELLVPRFFGQTEMIRSELILIDLTGVAFTTTVDFLIYDDNEHAFSDEWTFQCWQRVPLTDISGAFRNDFLQGEETDPDEILGQETQESGWFRMNGAIAQSTNTVIQDPAFYAVLVECVVDERCVADLPFELCTQDNGDLLPGGLAGDQ